VAQPAGAEDDDVIEAIVFDLDGVLIDSEGIWTEARRDLVRSRGGRWLPDAQTAMMGMSSPEWSRYMRDTLGVDMAPADISVAVVDRMERLYRRHLPLLPGAGESVLSLAGRWPLALASSANRPLIDLVLDLARLQDSFTTKVSSEEVARGKPAPDVYLEAARRLGVDPAACAAVEDSTNGMRAAAAAGMSLIALPNRDFPPDQDAVGLADAVLTSLDELRPPLVSAMEGSHRVGDDP
jgi:HAD superfamily hydrolase (TIGR01509 family)